MAQFSRRDFLRNTLLGGYGAAAVAGGQLALMQSALAASSSVAADYRALVCVFLYGGNDSWNMLVPRSGDSRSLYETARQSLAVMPASASGLGNGLAGELGLHPSLARLDGLVDAGQLALQANVGPLLAPTTLAQYQNASVPLPAQLFSHNDQQATWMRGAEAREFGFGWAGRMLELLDDSGGFARNFSLSGNNLWQSSAGGNPFAVGSNGVPTIRAFNGTWWAPELRRSVYDQLATLADHPLEGMVADLGSNAITNADTVRTALDAAPELLTTFSENNRLSSSLAAVARLISTQPQLQPKRQVFFVGLGGWDTHDEQVDDHPALLATLADGLADFQAELDAQGLAEQVTTFTMSDFGRTLSSNGDGTDHAWGGHQWVMGGAVDGGKLYGGLPMQALDNGVDIGGGRMIPSTANQQMFASLAKWMGLSDSELLDIMPSLAYFDGYPEYFG